MKAILLAAGLGTRLQPFTGILPKCLMPINGRPLLEYWLHDLLATGVNDILINTHFHPDMVSKWLQGCVDNKTIKTVHEKELLGTAGTILQNCDFISNHPALIIHADNLCQVNFPAFIEAHEKRPAQCAITMMTFRTDTPETCGIVELDEKWVVQNFYEKVAKPPGNIANGAIYIIEPTVIDFLKSLKKTKIDFSTEVLPRYLGRIFTYHNDIYHRDIGNIESFLSAQTEFPGNPIIPATDKDPWETLCVSDSSNLAEQFFESISNAFGIVDANLSTNQIPIELLQRYQGAKILYLKKYPHQNGKNEPHYKNRAGTLRNEDLLLYLPKVNAGFSSRKIFEQYGVRSLALCASNKFN